MGKTSKSARQRLGKDLQFAMHLAFIFLITVSSVSGIKVWLQKKGFGTSDKGVQNARVFWPQHALALFPSPPPASESEDTQDQDRLPTAFVAISAYQQARIHQIPPLRYNRQQAPAQQKMTYRQPVYRKAPLRKRPYVHPKKTPVVTLVSAQRTSGSEDHEYSAYMAWVKQTLKTYRQGAN